MHNTPLISVIIPCFNSSSFIAAAINSVLTQTYKHYEIICIDNNSTDNTWQILTDYSKKYPDFFIEREMKPGAGAARNKGLSIAKGEWIQFLDADDIIYTHKFERHISLLQRDTKLLVSAFDMSINNGALELFKIEDTDPWSLLITSSLGNTVANFWNKQILDEVGFFNEKYPSSQEYELMFRILKKIDKKQIVIDHQPSMLYNRRLSGSISNNYEKNTITRIQLRILFKDFFLKSTEKNKNTLIDEVQNFILKDLRFLYTLNKQKAVELYPLSIDKNFSPQISFVTPWYYKIAYSILGFNLAEKLFAVKRKFISQEKEHHF